jgi:hypothetical protein
MTTTTTAAPRVATWVRVTAVLLAVPQLVTGLWAVLDARGWYDNFPGFGPMLVAAEPPFNAHLATDAGAGFIATGVVLVLAAAWGERRPLQLALAGLLAFAVAHLAYHAPNPSPLLSDTQNVVNTVGLALAAVIPLALLLATLPRKEAR